MGTKFPGIASCALVFLLLGAGVARPQDPAVAKVALPDPDAVFHDVLTRFYRACEKKDISAAEQVWHPQGPARHARNLLEVDFERRTAALAQVLVREASVDPGGGRARAIVDLDVTDAKTGQKRRERRVRDFTFLQDGGTWKIWNESPSAGVGSVGARLAQRLLDASSEEAAALIASDPEIRSDDVLAGLTVQANILRTKLRLQDVVEAFRRQEQLARAIDNQLALGRSLLEIGLVYQVAGRPQQALEAFAASRPLFEAHGGKAELATLDANLGSAHYVLGEYDKAAERYRAALAVYEAEKDSARAATTSHSLGNALYMLGDFEQALTCYERTLALHEAAANKYAGSSVLQAMALVHKEVGNYSAAVAAYSRSSAWSAEASDIVGAARAEHGLGDVFRLAGDYARALQHLAASRALWEKTGDPPSRAATLFLTGQVQALQRNFGAAIEWYQRALDLDRKSGEQAGVARDLGGLGGANFGAGKLDVALEQFQKSLELREQLKDVPGVMWTLAHLGVLHTALQDHASAYAEYQRALAIAESQGDGAAVCTVLALRAANELAREDAETALETADKAVGMAERLELFDALAYARTVAGRAHRGAGRKEDAARSFEEAIAAVERVPVGPGVETFFDDRRSPYFALVDFLVAENRPADAFNWWERARTNTLARQLGGDGSIVTKGLSAEERDRERRLASDARTAAVKLRRERARSKPDAARLEELQREVERLRMDTQQFRASLFAKYPALATLRAQADPARLESAGAPAAREALLSFAVGEDRTIVFVAVREGSSTQPRVDARLVEIAARDLATQVNAFREALRLRDNSAEAAGQQLHRLLLEDARPQLAASRSVVLMPDAFLWSLPFGALRGASHAYLAQDVAVSYASSLTALAAIRAGSGEPVQTSSPAARASLVIAADPVLSPAARERLAAIAAPADGKTPAASTREVQRLSLLFGARATQALLGQGARADRVAAAARAGAVLHLAVPAYLLERSPLHSMVALSAAGAEDETQGLVEVGDAMSWSLPADLVVLPRLEHVPAGGGGDGLAALRWSLFVAGSRSLLAARWPQSDAAASATLRAFYRAWLTRRAAAAPDAAVALQKAIRTVVAQPGSHPADWAGLMVLGR